MTGLLDYRNAGCGCAPGYNSGAVESALCCEECEDGKVPCYFYIDSPCVIRAADGEVILRDRTIMAYDCYRSCEWVSYWWACPDGRGTARKDMPMRPNFCQWPPDTAGRIPPASLCVAEPADAGDCCYPSVVLVYIAPGSIPDGATGSVVIAEQLHIVCPVIPTEGEVRAQFNGNAVALELTTGTEIPVRIRGFVECNGAPPLGPVHVQIEYELSPGRVVTTGYANPILTTEVNGECDTSGDDKQLLLITSPPSNSAITVQLHYGVGTIPGGAGQSTTGAPEPDSGMFDTNQNAPDQGLPAVVKWTLVGSDGVGILKLLTRSGLTATYRTENFSCVNEVTYTRVSYSPGLEMLPWCLCVRSLEYKPKKCLTNEDHCKCCDNGDEAHFRLCFPCPDGISCSDLIAYRQAPTTQYPCGEFYGNTVVSACVGMTIRSRCIGEDQYEVLVGCTERDGVYREKPATITSYDCTCYGAQIEFTGDLDCRCCEEGDMTCCGEHETLTLELVDTGISGLNAACQALVGETAVLTRNSGIPDNFYTVADGPRELPATYWGGTLTNLCNTGVTNYFMLECTNDQYILWMSSGTIIIDGVFYNNYIRLFMAVTTTPCDPFLLSGTQSYSNGDCSPFCAIKAQVTA